jgi:hypothetical protein
MVRAPRFRQGAATLVPSDAAGISAAIEVKRASGGSMRIHAAALAIAAVVVPCAETGAQTAASRWLDAKPVANWNKPGMAIPRGPKSGYAEEIADCEKRGWEGRPKPTVTAETRQVTAAGWLGTVVEKSIGDTVIVSARNGADGMCRPMDYQYFVFVGGKFAGTLSPRPMNSRVDGSGWLEEKPQAKRFSVDFARYRKDDALCCPARTSTVTYELREGPGGPLVIPARVATKANPR